MNFYVPPNLIQDFDDFLKTEACKTIKFCHDILANKPEWFEERVEITIAANKQRTFDKALKLTVSYNTEIQKGDVIEYNEMLYLVTLSVSDNQLNAKSTAMELLTSPLTFMRMAEAEIDENTAQYIEKGGYKKVCNEIRCALEFYGKNDYLLNVAQVGLFTKNSIVIYLQANEHTLQIKRGDIYGMYNDMFVIRSILYHELNYDGKSGVLLLQAEHTAEGGGK